MDVKNKPLNTFKVGAISASLWENKTDKGSFQTISLSRSYKDSSDEWKTTNTLRVNDLPKARMVLQKAYEASFVSA